MEIQDWLSKQKGLYPEVNNEIPPLAFHPINGEKQESSLLQNQFWWSGGASIEACQQLSDSDYPPNLGVISFGPVQSFLGSGQRLRDWAVASWLCHYLTGVLIYHWQDQGGKVLLPLHRNSPLVNWLHNSSDSIGEEFWRAELPNVVTGLFPDDQGWLNHIRHILISEWSNLIHNLESVAIAHEPRVLNGIGWRVIHGDNQNLWSVYTAETVLQVDTIIEQIKGLHQQIESQKIGRHWQGKWWGGRTSPSAGHFSAWHPGLQPIEKGGIWGLPDEQITQWWEGAVEKSQQTSFSRLAGLFSSGDRLNSLEMVKRLASVPEIIMPTLEQIWGKSPPPCPWERFPDRTAIAASWVYHAVKPEKWNDTVDILAEVCFENKSKPKWSKSWGIPTIDQQSPKFSHPRILERRNIDEEALEIWQDELPQSWESTIEWTVGWRGDGDKMGEWLSGKQYQKQNLWWKKWHLTPEIIKEYSLNLQVPEIPETEARKVDLPHLLDLGVLFNYWNQLLYPLVEENHDGRVIFAGGDDFLLLAPITEAISLTNDLYDLWHGKPSSLTQPLEPPVDGWINYQNQVYPVPGSKMTFSLGVVIAQRRIPQSLWHRGLNQAYKEAKNQGRNRICVKVLFNSGQSLQWICPWQLWQLLMTIKPNNSDQTELNCWEKLLFYFDNTRLQQNSLTTVRSLVNTLWASVGLPLSWQHIEQITHNRIREFPEITRWQWWLNWLALRGFLARQEREREKWQNLVN